MDRDGRRQIVEALILASPEPVTAAKLAEAVPRATPKLVRELVDELNGEYGEQGRAFEIWQVAGGYQFRSRLEFAKYLQRLHPQRPVRLSRAALETLAIVAYNQPATRAEVDHIRGVDSGPILRGLIDRNLVRIAGHRDVPGRPMLYGTTKRFLEVFGLTSLEDLPTLRDLRELAEPAGLAGELAGVLGEEDEAAAAEDDGVGVETEPDGEDEGSEGPLSTAGPDAPGELH